MNCKNNMSLRRGPKACTRSKRCSNTRCAWLLNPFISDIGSLLPQVISGAAIVSVVMSLPTTGPMLLSALRSQDMYLAGSFLMFMAFLTVIGVFVSDLALALLDPRIRLQAGRRQ